MNHFLNHSLKLRPYRPYLWTGNSTMLHNKVTFPLSCQHKRLTSKYAVNEKQYLYAPDCSNVLFKETKLKLIAAAAKVSLRQTSWHSDAFALSCRSLGNNSHLAMKTNTASHYKLLMEADGCLFNSAPRLRERKMVPEAAQSINSRGRAGNIFRREQQHDNPSARWQFG